jgi:hypothetical protein
MLAMIDNGRVSQVFQEKKSKSAEILRAVFPGCVFLIFQ